MPIAPENGLVDERLHGHSSFVMRHHIQSCSRLQQRAYSLRVAVSDGLRQRSAPGAIEKCMVVEPSSVRACYFGLSGMVDTWMADCSEDSLCVTALCHSSKCQRSLAKLNRRSACWQDTQGGRQRPRVRFCVCPQLPSPSPPLVTRCHSPIASFCFQRATVHGSQRAHRIMMPMNRRNVQR